MKKQKKQFEKFKEQVKKCFDHSYLLYDIYEDIKYFEKKLQKKDDFTNTILHQLNTAFYLILNAQTRDQFAYAYVSLYFIIEIINNQYIQSSGDNGNKKWIIKSNENNVNVLDWYWNSKESKYYNNNQDTTVESKLPEWHKFAGILF